MIKLQSGKNSHNQIITRKRICLWIFFIRKINIKWLSYISVDGSEKWLWKFFPIVVFSIFWKIDKQWRTLALIRCTSNILSKSCIRACHYLHFWKVFSDFPESVLQLVFFRKESLPVYGFLKFPIGGGKASGKNKKRCKKAAIRST